MEPDRVLGALVVIATAAVLVAFYRMRDRRRTKGGAKHGVAVRVECPEDHQPADVRIGKTATGELSVLWCDRFTNRPIGCRQACFISVPSGDGDASIAKGG